MTKLETIRGMLAGGDRRSLGRAGEVVARLQTEPERIGPLVKLLWDLDVVVRMRAADCLEKLARENAAWIAPHKAELIGLMAESRQQEVRWHLALMMPRMELTQAEVLRVAGMLEAYLEDRSAIVKTCAMKGLWELSLRDGRLRDGVVERIRELTRTGTAAMRARGRKLLSELAKEDGAGWDGLGRG